MPSPRRLLLAGSSPWLILRLSAHGLLVASVTLLTITALYLLQAPHSDIVILSVAGVSILVPLLRYRVLAGSTKAAYAQAFALGEALRLELLRHLRKLPLGAVANLRRGGLVSLLNDDIRWVENFVGGGASLLISASLIPIFLILAGAYIHGPTALVLAAGIGLGLPVVYAYSRFMARSVAERAVRLGAVTARVGEHFTGMQVLRAFNAVGLKDRGFKNDLTQLLAGYRRATLRLTPLSVLGLFIMESSLAFAAYLSFVEVDPRSDDGVRAVLTLIAALAIYNPLLLMFAGTGQLRLAKTAEQRLQRFFALPSLAEAGANLDMPQRPELKFEQVDFSYDGETEALQNINFVARAGEVTAIVGPSGAGKSTIFNLACRFWEPEDGGISVGGVDIRNIGSDRLCRLVSLVSQDLVLINDSLRRNIDLGLPGYSDESLQKVLDACNAMGFVQRLPQGLDTPLGEAGGRLSGGERQRITLARALLRDAPIVLLDEALSSVDPSNARDIQRSIRALTAGKTVLVIAHHLSSIVEADKILVMDEGRIVAEGRHQELLSRCELYGKLWQDHCDTRSWELTN